MEVFLWVTIEDLAIAVTTISEIDVTGIAATNAAKIAAVTTAAMEYG